MGQMAKQTSPLSSAPDSGGEWWGFELLEFERVHWGPGDNKEDLVRHRFGLGLPAYYQRLYRACRSAEAVTYDALLVRSILDASDRAMRDRLDTRKVG